MKKLNAFIIILILSLSSCNQSATFALSSVKKVEAQPLIIEGCTHSEANNFNPLAEQELGNCSFEFCGEPSFENSNVSKTQIVDEYLKSLKENSIEFQGNTQASLCENKMGCRAPLAKNFDPEAVIETGTCEFKGCPAYSVDLDAAIAKYQAGFPMAKIDNTCPGLKTENFTQNEDTHAGILWVVDNSGSMGNEQANLAKNFSSFIDLFLAKNINFTMGVTTTDSKHSLTSLSQLTSAEAKNDELKFKDNFRNLIKVGITGSGREKGYNGSKTFLDNTTYKDLLLTEANSHLITIYISDEPDQSNQDAQYYIDHFKTLVPKTSMFQSHAIVDLDNSGRADATKGAKYLESVTYSKGTSGDIQGNFATVLSKIGQSIVELLDQFILASVPYEPSIKVFVNDVETTDWTFITQQNSIKFTTAPAEGAKIKITYLPAP